MRNEKNISMKVVREETGLTSRQIRYYDQVGLIFPARSEGNQRLFSREDIKRLKKIKKLLESGNTIEAVREKLNLPSVIEENNSNSNYNSFRTEPFAKEKLTSLYPVSNRSGLIKLLVDYNNNKEEE